MLPRNSAFPAAQRQHVYAFDPIPDADLRRYKREARAYLLVMGDDGGDAASKVWVVSDIRDPFFGKPVPEDLLGADGDPPCLVGEKGIVSWDGSSRFCELVSRADLDAKPSSGDSRILPVVTDLVGKRNRTLRDAVSAFTVHTITDWPHQGPRAFSEFVSSVAAAVDTWVAYHAEWARTSGVGSGTAPAHEHRILCEYMRLSHSVDQMNCPKPGEH